jgi:GrpB-like predicted nucleotidyltransferase (UPF0157 family)
VTDGLFEDPREPLKLTVGPYEEAPAQCHEYDPRSPEVAGALARAILEQAPTMRVEHVGSTAVPGCDGKGIIDLLVMYPNGGLEVAKKALVDLGYQPQKSGNPFPEDRPMRTGTVLYKGMRFRVHAHVVWASSPEAANLILFRDRLRGDPTLLAEYVARKRSIIGSGITHTGDYSNAKSTFIRRAAPRDDTLDG